VILFLDGCKYLVPCSFLRFQDPFCISEVNFFEDILGQIKAIHIPASLHRDRRSIIVKVFIIGLEKAVDNSVGFWIRSQIRAKQDAVRMIQKELSGGIRLAPELADPG